MKELSDNPVENMAHQLTSPALAPSGFDLQVLQDLRELIGEDADVMVTQLIDCFVHDTTELLQTMSAAIAAANFAELRTIAHSLKSSSASLGAMHLSELARDLEMLAQAGKAMQALEKLTQLSAEFGQVRTFLLSEIDSKAAH